MVACLQHLAHVAVRNDFLDHLVRNEVGLTSTLLLAMTGYVQECDRLCARETCFVHHFAKPLDIRKLQTILNATP